MKFFFQLIVSIILIIFIELLILLELGSSHFFLLPKYKKVIPIRERNIWKEIYKTNKKYDYFLNVTLYDVRIIRLRTVNRNFQYREIGHFVHFVFFF